MKNPKVVIVGGGFAGLNAARALKHAPLDVLLIDRTNYHLFQPLLYQVATAALSPADIAAPIREIVADQKNTEVILEEIVSIDKENKRITAKSGDTFPFDYLILAPGSRHSYFGHPEWEAFAPGLKTLDDGLRIREQILLSYEIAERCQDPEEALKYMRFIVIGGGPTGVEMAGAIAEIARQSLVKNFRHIKPEQTKIYLIEGASQILPSFPKDLADKAKKDLEQLGVEVLLNTYVTEVNAEGVLIGDHFIKSQNIIWAAGNAASPLLRCLETKLDRGGRVLVNADLSLPGFPTIFIVGDAACLTGKDGSPLPGVAPVAMQQGFYVAKTIRNELKGKDRKPFSYFDKGMMATIGKKKAIVSYGKFHLSGYFAWLAWCFVHVAYLISFPHKLLVMMEWYYLYLFNERRARLITRPVKDKKNIT